MYYGLAVLIGALIAVMVAVNGGLTSWYGAFGATVIIHIVGLVLVSVILIVRKESPIVRKRLPFYCFLGGLVGVFTTLFNNMAFGLISVSAITALGLLGQGVISVFIDHFGLFGMKKRPFDKKKLIGYAAVLLGVLVMLIF